MIFSRDRKALELDRLEVEVVGRAKEAEWLGRVLSGVNTGLVPKLISIYGPPGSGKTLVTRRVCTEYEKNSGGVLRFVYVNLGEVKTVFSCANRLLVALGGRWKAGRAGLDGVMEEFWTRLLDWKDGQIRFLLICFDEADKLFVDERSDPSGFIYRLVRSQERLSGSGTNLSLITISNTPIWEIWSLDARVRSSMGTEEIFFQSYARQDLQQILLGRCREAFGPGVIDEKVIEAIVNYTAEQSRDVRRMVDLVRICGEIAEAQNDQKVEMKHYTEALKRLEMDHYKPLLDSMAEIQRRLLVTIAWLSEFERVTAPSTSQVYDEYQKIFEKAIPGYRRVAGVLKELEVMNLIGMRNVSKGRGGRINEIWLKIPAHVVLEHTRGDWEMKSFERLQKKLDELGKMLHH
jgi:cell division control protein 6